MTRLWPEGESIEVDTDEEGRPVGFTWQGQSYRLHQIQQRWQVDNDWWREEGRIWRDYLAVTTTTGLLCVIYRDLAGDGWFVAKVYD